MAFVSAAVPKGKNHTGLRGSNDVNCRREGLAKGFG
jgi:hypothetical protein